MTNVQQPERVVFSGADGNRMVADVLGSGPVAVLLHGGGQTRHSWNRTAQAIAASGQTAVAVDMRGHGDSDWSADRTYSRYQHADDVRAICGQVEGRPALIGASMGGIASLIATGDSADGGRSLARCLALVDVTPRMESAGVDRILDFMLSAPSGFASIEEAAEAVAGYLPGRPRPKSASGLIKNLRLGSDDRYHWHWDPHIVEDMPTDSAARERMHAELSTIARRVSIPTLLVRGGDSDVVSAESVRELKALIPHAEVAEVSRAGHMVAGDDNHTFAGAILDFLARSGA
jgi:pimeloyl-ACP methyl ester carboxylesterase